MDRSYGVQVAKLAGMPRSVLMRANQVLSALNSTDQKNTPNTIKTLETLPLFEQSMANTQLTKKTTSEIETQLENTDPDGMTPKEALDLIYKLKEMILN